MRDFHEEPALLQALEERLKSARVLITFNGKSFDIPLLKSRFTLTRRDLAAGFRVPCGLAFPSAKNLETALGRLPFGES